MKPATFVRGSGGANLGAWRHGLWVVGLVSAFWLACLHFPLVWLATGIGEANRPFIDLYNILAACDAVQAGVDPFLPNNFDPYHRPHFYTEWWLELARLGLGRADALWLGYALLAAVLLTVAVTVRPRTRLEGMNLFLLLVSPAFLLAVNRANNDLVAFVIISLGLILFRRERWPWRALAVILFALSAVLKYTPLVTLVVLLDLRTRRGLSAALGLYGLVLVLAWPTLGPGLKSAAQFAPMPDWLYAFGAPVILRNLGINAPLGWLVPAVLMAGWALWCASGKIAEPEREGSPQGLAAEREFICGAAMLVGVFFLGASYVYKLIFAIWLLPWLWQDCGGGVVESRWSRMTWRLLLGVVWLEGAMATVLNLVVGPWSQPVALWLLKVTLVATQLVTWALVACLLRFLFIHVGRRSRFLLRNGRPPGLGRL